MASLKLRILDHFLYGPETSQKVLKKKFIENPTKIVLAPSGNPKILEIFEGENQKNFQFEYHEGSGLLGAI